MPQRPFAFCAMAKAHITSITAGVLSSNVPAVEIPTLWNSTLPLNPGGIAGIEKLPKPPTAVVVV